LNVAPWSKKLDGGANNVQRRWRVGWWSSSTKSVPGSSSAIPISWGFCSGTSKRETALEAAIAAGYPDGSCARRNAQKRAARADVKALVAELRAPIAEKLEITLAVLIERADQIYRQAMLAGQFNAAISALKELGVLSGKRIEGAERGEPGEFDRMSDGSAGRIQSPCEQRRSAPGDGADYCRSGEPIDASSRNLAVKHERSFDQRA
jgi:hypothetical protein